MGKETSEISVHLMIAHFYRKSNNYSPNSLCSYMGGGANVYVLCVKKALLALEWQIRAFHPQSKNDYLKRRRFSLFDP